MGNFKKLHHFSKSCREEEEEKEDERDASRQTSFSMASAQKMHMGRLD